MPSPTTSTPSPSSGDGRFSGRYRRSVSVALLRDPDPLTWAMIALTGLCPPVLAGWWWRRQVLVPDPGRYGYIAVAVAWFVAVMVLGPVALLAPLWVWVMLLSTVTGIGGGLPIRAVFAVVPATVLLLMAVAGLDGVRRFRYRPALPGPVQVDEDLLEAGVAEMAYTDLDIHGWHIGVDSVTAESVTVPAELLDGHGLVVGESGTGKTVLLADLMGWAAGTRSDKASICLIDLKGDPAFVDAAAKIAARAGREFKFFSIEERPERSAWNPIAHGDYTANKDRLIDGYDWTEPYFKGLAETGLQRILRFLDEVGARASLATVSKLLTPGFLIATIKDADGDHADMAAWAQHVAKDANAVSAMADMRAKLELLTDSTAGAMLLPAAPAERPIDLVTDLDSGAIVVFSLDAGMYPELAQRIAGFVARELVVVGSIRRSRPAVERTQVLVIADEFPSAPSATSQFAAGFQTARDAGMSYVLACQSYQNLLDLDDTAAATLIASNARLRIAGRDKVGAEELAALSGTGQSWEPTLQTTDVGAGQNPIGTASTGVGSLRRVDEFRVHPNTYRYMPNHRFVVDLAGTDSDPAPPIVLAVPHYTHPTATAPDKPELDDPVDDDDLPSRWERHEPRISQAVSRVAVAGGLLAAVAVPASFVFSSPDTTPSAPPVFAAPAIAGDGVAIEVARAVFDAWLATPGVDRDRRLAVWTRQSLSAAPIDAIGPVTVVAIEAGVDGTLWATASIPTAAGATGWQIGLYGAGDVWALTTPPVPVAAAVRAVAPVQPRFVGDAALTEALSPLIVDAITAWGAGTDGDVTRLASATVTDFNQRPIGGLVATDLDVAVAADPFEPQRALARISVTWTATGTDNVEASYDLTLAENGGRWLIAAITPTPYQGDE